MSQYIKVDKCPDKGYAIITIAKEPVNSFDTELWTALYNAFQSVESDAAMRGLIITSGLRREVFSGGIDLKELYAPNTSAERYARFWSALSNVLVGLYRSRLATLAAIKGACPAGGCAISMCCDMRLMTRRSGTIGLNEVPLGIPVPKFWAKLMGHIIGPKVAEQLVLTGRLVKAEEALQIGLVDELVDGAEELLPRAEQLMAVAVKLPGEARAATKLSLRGEFAGAWEEYAQTREATFGWGAIAKPETVARMTATLQRLSGKGSKPQAKL
jgi:3,2-trans-enoyl-CoA isomerase